MTGIDFDESLILAWSASFLLFLGNRCLLRSQRQARLNLNTQSIEPMWSSYFQKCYHENSKPTLKIIVMNDPRSSLMSFRDEKFYLLVQIVARQRGSAKHLCTHERPA